MSSSLEPGTVIAGRYRLDRQLGQGGMGVVWSATHMITRRAVAMKFLKGPAHARPEMRRRFLREARAASAVKHPSVVEVHDVFELDDETPVMVMDLLSGQTLADRIDAVGTLSLDETATILLPVVSAVGTAHARGVVHRDLKPENIFLAINDEGQTEVKVLDFGIAKLSNADGEMLVQSQLTGTGSMLGTPFYSAPEQLFGERYIDQRADVWALGVVLYECLSGQIPVYGENLGQVMKVLTSSEIVPLERVAPHVPADVAALVNRMLAKAMADRPNDLREVLELLRRYSPLRVRGFSEARSQPPPPQDPAQPSEGGAQRPPLQSQDGATVLESGGRRKTPIDTASPHAVSQTELPRSRKIMMSVAAALGALAIGAIGWQLGRTRDGSGAAAGAGSQETPALVAPPTIEPVKPQAANPEPPAPAASPNAVEAATHTAEPLDKSKVLPQARPALARAPAGKPDAGAKSNDSDASKANQKRPGGLIEDVPF
jgi:serine/threonine-protein kinase